MERRLSQTTIYQGLFIVGFALFAHERLNTKTLVVATTAPESEEAQMIRSKPLYRAYLKMKVDSLFSANIDGVTLSYEHDRLRVSIENDEVYRNQEFQMEKDWAAFFDRLALLFEDHLKTDEFEIRVIGYPDLRNALDRQTNALDKSALGLAISRADATARQLKRVLARYKNLKFELSAGSSSPSGHRIDIEVQSI